MTVPPPTLTPRAIHVLQSHQSLSLPVQEPDTLITPMACCGFLHVDHLLEIELELANVMYHAEQHVDIAIPAT